VQLKKIADIWLQAQQGWQFGKPCNKACFVQISPSDAKLYRQFATVWHFAELVRQSAGRYLILTRHSLGQK
jgi:hypothetical protein